MMKQAISNEDTDSASIENQKIEPSTTAIQRPPEMIQYETEYDETDNQLEEYLATKYAKQIDSFQFFPIDILIRFVLGYKHIGKGAYAPRKQETDRLFAKYLEFHKTSEYDVITSKLSAQKTLELMHDVCFYGHDKYGHPVIYNNGERYKRNGDLSVFKDTETNDFDAAMVDRFIAFCLKRVHELKIENTKRYLALKEGQVGIYQMCVVIDLTGFSVPKFLSERKMFEYMTRRATEVTPDSLHRVYLINAPWVFRQVWNIFRHFVHPVTVQKTVILGNDYMEELQKEIDIHMIPKEFGGEGRWNVKCGDIPDGFYEE